MTTNKFSIHSLLGGASNDSVNPGMAQYNTCNPVVPPTTLTSAHEAALRAAFCNGYATNVMQPCSTVSSSLPSAIPATAPTPVPTATPVPNQPSPGTAMNGMNLALAAQTPNQYTPAVTTAAILRPPGSSPITWQPLAIYQDPRWTLPPQPQSSTLTEGEFHFVMISARLLNLYHSISSQLA